MSKATPFDQPGYWSDRFEHEQTFEWLMPWSVLEPHMRALSLLPQDMDSTRILNLGCGNSTLPLDLHQAGYHHVTSVDFVGSVVQRMKEHCEKAIGWSSPKTEPEAVDELAASHLNKAVVASSSCPLQFLEMDCLDMSSLPANKFNLCLDKSTSDAIACGDDENSTKIRKLCEQVARVVQPGGIWCVISYSRFRQYEWNDGGVGHDLWKTERIESIQVEPPSIGDRSSTQLNPPTGSKPAKGQRSTTEHVVHVPEVFQYLYVNYRL
ncbi:hypothetical protein BGW38_005442 [Lunasporangiospora selenospora]|uniref:Methyltransferase domain-containing protein n=1 Tax=Lunasporangiospora selenospora TaxID=979761 RepID=A0A9P6FZJ7_9FUNG|nr:hypothetical protein BGW38_005442 [Lunasporangiospora selenospora]